MNTLKLIKESSNISPHYKQEELSEKQEVQFSRMITKFRRIMLDDHPSFHSKTLKNQKATIFKTLSWTPLSNQANKTKELNDICTILRNQKSINSISFTLWFQNRFEIRALALTMQKLKCLRTLKLTLGYWEYINGFSKKIFLSGLKHLNSLKLSFDNNIDNNGLKELSIGLRKLSALSELYLEASGNQISDKGLFALSQGLEYLKSLSSFTLFIINISITDEGIKSISQSVKYLKLSSLSLHFDSCYEISDKGLESIFLSLQGNDSLLHFELDFISIMQITDTSFQSLSKCLEILKSKFFI